MQVIRITWLSSNVCTTAFLRLKIMQTLAGANYSTNWMSAQFNKYTYAARLLGTFKDK